MAESLLRAWWARFRGRLEKGGIKELDVNMAGALMIAKGRKR